MKLIRYVSQFAKDDDDAYTRIEFVQEPSLQYLVQLVGAPAGDPLYDEFELTEGQLRQLAPLMARQPDATKYVYFLSCSQAN